MHAARESVMDVIAYVDIQLAQRLVPSGPRLTVIIVFGIVGTLDVS